MLVREITHTKSCIHFVNTEYMVIYLDLIKTSPSVSVASRRITLSQRPLRDLCSFVFSAALLKGTIENIILEISMLDYSICSLEASQSNYLGNLVTFQDMKITCVYIYTYVTFEKIIFEINTLVYHIHTTRFLSWENNSHLRGLSSQKGNNHFGILDYMYTRKSLSLEYTLIYLYQNK